MLRLALQLLEEGSLKRPLAVAQAIEREIPFSSLESRVFTDNYLAFSEATELARIYGKCSGTLGKPELKQKAFALLRDETERLRTLAALLHVAARTAQESNVRETENRTRPAVLTSGPLARTRRKPFGTQQNACAQRAGHGRKRKENGKSRPP